MKINYIFRSKDLKAYSIENVFDIVASDISQKNVVKKFYLPGARYSIKNFYKNLRYVSKLNGDVFHITGDVHYIALALKKNVILTIHDLRMLNVYKKNSLKYLIYKLFWVILPIRKSSMVTVISEKTKQEVIRIYPKVKDKIRVVGDPVNKIFKYSPKKFNEKKPKLLLIGTKENKNHLRMINAISGLSCELVIIGTIPAQEVTLLNKNNITYINEIGLSDEEILKCYELSDIIMFASTYEGFGMPIVEAQTVGRVVLTSNLEPMSSVAGKGACLVDPYSTDSIRKMVLKIINDAKFRKKIVEDGLKNSKNYSSKKISEKYMSIYKSVCEGIFE